MKNLTDFFIKAIRSIWWSVALLSVCIGGAIASAWTNDEEYLIYWVVLIPAWIVLIVQKYRKRSTPDVTVNVSLNNLSEEEISRVKEAITATNRRNIHN